MKIRFLSNTNIRPSNRDFSLAPIGVIFAGVEIEVEDRLYRGKELDGINTYFKDDRGWYYWSGRAAIIYKAIAPPVTEKMVNPEQQERIGGDWEIQVEEPDSAAKMVTTKPIQPKNDPPAFPIDPRGSDRSEQSTEVQIRKKQVNPEWNFQYDQGLVHWGLLQHHLPEWWKTEKLSGKGIKVAVLGTGIDTQHPDLVQLIKQVRNFCSADPNEIMDQDGQATRYAGLIAGRGMMQYLGVAPDIQLWIARIMGHGLDLQVDRIWEALDWIFRYPIDIVLFAFDLRSDSLTRAQKIRFQTYIDQAISKGMVLLAPMGESSGSRAEDRFPAAFPKVLGIGAHDQQGQRLINGVRGYSLNILAPGVALFPKEESANLSGTSASATAYTAGILSLAMEFAQRNYLRRSPSDWLDLLKQTASAKYLLTKCKDIEYGCGLLQPTALLEALRKEVGEHAPDNENNRSLDR